MPASVDPIAHKRHDQFNLLSIPIIIVANVSYLYCFWLHKGSADESIDFLFMIMFWAFILYMFIDILWLLYSPNCVASPILIILHHLVSIAGWLTPAFDVRIRPWTAVAVSVEINTFFLIARRNFPPHMLLDSAFLVSWVVLRCGVYPFLVVGYYRQFSEFIHPANGLNVYSISFICVLLLTVLNLKWTVDLIRHSRKCLSVASSSTLEQEEKKGL